MLDKIDLGTEIAIAKEIVYVNNLDNSTIRFKIK